MNNKDYKTINRNIRTINRNINIAIFFMCVTVVNIVILIVLKLQP